MMRVMAPHDAPQWGLRNARVPACLTAGPALASDGDGLAKVDLMISGEQVQPAYFSGTSVVGLNASPDSERRIE